MLTRPILLLRLEGLALLAAAVALYAGAEASWWWFALLLFVPDVAMIGYAFGPSAGAALYNLAHNTALPLGMALFGHLAGRDLAVEIALIWLAHVGLDRALGYGLKSPTGFHDTHLGRIGKGARP